MISFKPSRRGSVHLVLPLTMILCGMVAFIGAACGYTAAPSVLWAVGAAALAGSVPIILRYTLATFVYTIDEETPGLLCVHRYTGGKKTTPVTADLRFARGVRLLTPDGRAAARGTGRVNMCLNLFPERRMAIAFETDGRICELILETDAEFFAEVEKRVRSGVNDVQ